ncbi:glycosyltransferase family 4 protein [Polluticaenibacter yanchengensis]|uniref:Glycosyltransferase family 4 protein n=1 Tax=Polluticaenibacter yanchengensis TaxID=3014562 RepID=A0ABT4UHP1_9BACT|nr:glycosyltransferase family 4 protein [Chitinophagaceae bacterium LY-5]
MINASPYLLWICSWYPNKTSLYDGDFIQRHAESVALYKKVVVVTFYKDNNITEGKSFEIERNEKGNLKEYIVYYKAPEYSINRVDNLLNIFTYLKIGKIVLAKIVNEMGVPELFHAHIILNAGMLARWASNKYKVPYFLSEQWVEYLPEAKPNFRNINYWSKRKWQKVTAGAKGVSAVSKYLGAHLTRLQPVINPVRIPNVVNDLVFNMNDIDGKVESGNVIRFLHISTGTYQKNMEGMMAAFDLLQRDGVAFELSLILSREARKKLSVLIDRPYVKLLSERSQVELALLYKTHDAFVLFSRYETFGCVIIEANACGLPVIGSDMAVLKEIIQHGKNGLLARNEDPADLYERLLEYLKCTSTFDKQGMSAHAIKAFNYSVVGKQFLDFYEGK